MIRAPGPRWQAALMVVCCLALVLFWMLPAILAGYPPFLPGIEMARDFSETGMFSANIARLMTLFLSAMHAAGIGWRDSMGWTWLNASLMSASVVAFWLLVRRLFGAGTAWVATLIYALMPMYWLEAVKMDGYALGLLLTFLSALVFLTLSKRHFWVAVILSGLLLGFAVSARDALVTFVPWVCLTFLWIYRRSWKKGVLAAFLFGSLSVAGYLSPLLVPVLNADGGLRERTSLFLSSIGTRDAGLNHLYPDDYTYEFNRADYDAMLRQKAASGSFLDRRNNESYRLLFGVEPATSLARLKAGLWVFLNQFPSLIFPQTVGGAFLWLFIIPGIVVLWRRHRPLMLFYLGMILWMELVVRFALLYTRSHLMDVGWGLAIFAGAGVMAVAPVLQREWKRWSTGALVALLTAIIALQLVQANRKEFATYYVKSPVLETYAATAALDVLPLGAVVAHPNRWTLFTFKGYKNAAMIHADTIARLAPQGKIAEPFEYYKVSHLIGYTDEDIALIKKALPNLQVVKYEVNSSAVKVTPLLQYLLHLFR
ncbi:MAG: glycosyltransferase family 39 protein [Candidatus Peribacteraceae bacterium]